MLLAPLKTWRWTVEKYDRAAALGFFNDQRVELIEGRIVQMPPQKEPHAVTLMVVREILASAFGAGHVVRPQLPLHLGKASKPEPDIAVTAGLVRDSLQTGTPQEALLVVEISDVTLRFERRRKAAMYAKHKIADYWIVNLVERQIEVHRDPIRDPKAPFKHRYANVTICKPSDSISPLAAPKIRIPVAHLLP